MKYDDLEKTSELFDIVEDVPTPINNIEMEGANKNNVTDEFTLGLTDKESNIIKDEIKVKDNKKKEKKEKKSIKQWWINLPKKNKITAIILMSLVLIAFLILILVIFLKKDDKKPDTNPTKPDSPQVMIEKENYIYKDGELTFLDKEDKEIGTYTCKNKEEKLCYVAYFSNEDEFDIPKNIYEDEKLIERRSNIYNNKYVFIYDNLEENGGSITLYNIEESKEEGIYSLVKGFSDSNYVILKDNNSKYGAIEFTEDKINEKIKFTFDYLGRMNKDSKLVAKTNNKYFIYNEAGKLESKGIAYNIKSYNNNYIVVDNNGYYLYDYKSNLVIDEAYNFIRLLDNYVGLVKDSKLFIKDYKNQKYNEEGILLYNNDYNETNIYTKDKVLTGTKKSFDIAVVENNIEVTYITKAENEKTVTITTNEGKLSSNYAYLNYFNGKLYFYKEEEKTNLIGSYTCSNKNTVEKDTKTFSNCLIAKDSFYSKNETEKDESANIGWIPIINERYVFILDTMDIKNPTIVLYDLKNNKTLSKYESVDTGSYTKEEKVTFKTTNSTYIMAKNKNNKYGLIKIEDEVKSAISFDYTSFEKLKDNYVAKDNTNSYVLLEKNGNKLASSKYLIVDYTNKYIKVLSENKYYVYNYNGTPVDETGYLHITLENDYYAVITIDKKLDLRKYDNQDFKLKTPIDIGTEDYKNAYKVGKNSAGYLITITGKNPIQVGEDGLTEEERQNTDTEEE